MVGLEHGMIRVLAGTSHPCQPCVSLLLLQCPSILIFSSLRCYCWGQIIVFVLHLYSNSLFLLFHPSRPTVLLPPLEVIPRSFVALSVSSHPWKSRPVHGLFCCCCRCPYWEEGHHSSPARTTQAPVVVLGNSLLYGGSLLAL